DDFDPNSVPGCFFINPGQDVMLNVDTDGDGTVELAHVPASYFGLPEYKRSYTGLEFFWERAGDRFHTQGSYTFSRSRGNMEGYVNSTLEQDDPGLTQDLDHPLFTHGAFGPLPNDRTHTLKAFGMYELTEERQLAGNLIAQTGRPVNCQGYVPLELAGEWDVGTLNAYSGSSFYCLNEDGTRTLHNRGDPGRTPWTWTFDEAVAYIPNWADGKLEVKPELGGRQAEVQARRVQPVQQRRGRGVQRVQGRRSRRVRPELHERPELPDPAFDPLHGPLRLLRATGRSTDEWGRPRGRPFFVEQVRISLSMRLESPG